MQSQVGNILFSESVITKPKRSVPDVSQVAVGVSHRAPLSQPQVYIMLQLVAKVIQLQVFFLQIPGEATL